MKATGIVRRIDDLGRIVIPKEIRRTLHIRETDPLEIFTGQEGEIILKKYSPVGELGDSARQVADVLAQTKRPDRLYFLRPGFYNRRIRQIQKRTDESGNYRGLRRVIQGRSGLTAKNTEKDYVVPVSSISPKLFAGEIIFPILAEGDTAGAVLLLSPDTVLFAEGDVKLASAAALILGRQLES